LSFALDGWSALGGKVSVSLVDQVAVLVGHNGAGKSAILEGFETISSLAVGSFRWPRQFDIDNIPKILDVEILTPTKRRLQYHYELIVFSSFYDDELDSSIDDSATEISDSATEISDSATEISEDNLFVWNDSCQYIDGAQEHLWTTEMGMTEVGGVVSGPVGGGTSLLAQAKLRSDLGKNKSLLEEMHWVYVVLGGVRLLGKTPIRQTYSRRRCLLQISGKRVFSTSDFSYGKVHSLARRIFRLKTVEFNEFESICQRIGLGDKITLQEFVLKQEFKEITKNENEEYVISVSLDGVNIGLLSDGTLRVLSLLIELIISHPSMTTIIEEPETQIHPGMLRKLLKEIKAYTFGENLIVSTHSPQVVTWTSPDKINVVYRNYEKTIVRKLDEEEIQQVVDYLDEEGNLGEWLYSGILDE
jgi:hypothetical protein